VRIFRLALGALIAGALLLLVVLVLNGGIEGLLPASDVLSGGQTNAVPIEESTATSTTEVPPTATASPTPSPTASPTLTSTPTATPTSSPTATSVPTETPTPLPPTPTPGGDTLLPATPVADFGSNFDNRVWVGLYGTCAGRGLGILGTVSATETVTLAVQQAIAYQVMLTGTQVVPFFHMVTTIADPHPGPDGDYVHRVTTETIGLWVEVAQAHGLFSVLDVHPGYSTITEEVAYLGPFLQQPGVHLALDPEFSMLDGVSVPGQKIGSMTGTMVNEAQAQLNEYALLAGERKALIIHEFDNRMFSGKEDLIDYPNVDLVWDSDGFGGPGAKIADYNQYATEPGFEYGGLKLFYNYDVPVMQPAAVLELDPLPAFVVYQ